MYPRWIRISEECYCSIILRMFIYNGSESLSDFEQHIVFFFKSNPNIFFSFGLVFNIITLPRNVQSLLIWLVSSTIRLPYSFQVRVWRKLILIIVSNFTIKPDFRVYFYKPYGSVSFLWKSLVIVLQWYLCTFLTSAWQITDRNIYTGQWCDQIYILGVKFGSQIGQISQGGPEYVTSKILRTSLSFSNDCLNFFSCLWPWDDGFIVCKCNLEQHCWYVHLTSVE